MLKILSLEQDNPSSKIRYLIPFSCWTDLLALNSQLQVYQNLIIPQQFIIQDHIQTIQTKERQALNKLVTQKVNYLQIDNLILNPKLKTATKWKTVSKKLFHILKSKIHFNNFLPLIFHQDPKQIQNQIFSVNGHDFFKQIKLLLCSSTQNHLFYGFIHQKTDLQKFIKEIITFFDYFSTQDTKITFLQSNQFRNFKFGYPIAYPKNDSQFIMVHGLQRLDEKACDFIDQFADQNFKILSYQSPRLNRIERNGDEMTMADEDSRTLSDHTMSTGAETPFTFEIEDQYWDIMRPYHKNSLFGQKLQQQIQHMKEYAREAIYTDIIQSPFVDQTNIRKQLQKLAEDIQENIEKKKMYQKEIAKDVKQYLKENKQSIYSLYIKDKQLSCKDQKEICLKKMQFDQKTKIIKPQVYFESEIQKS